MSGSQEAGARALMTSLHAGPGNLCGQSSAVAWLHVRMCAGPRCCRRRPGRAAPARAPTSPAAPCGGADWGLLRRTAWRRCRRCPGRAACAWAPHSSASSCRGAPCICPTPHQLVRSRAAAKFPRLRTDYLCWLCKDGICAGHEVRHAHKCVDHLALLCEPAGACACAGGQASIGSCETRTQSCQLCLRRAGATTKIYSWTPTWSGHSTATSTRLPLGWTLRA